MIEPDFGADGSAESEAKRAAWARFHERKYRAELRYGEAWDSAIEEYQRTVGAAESKLMRIRDRAWLECKAEIDRALADREQDSTDGLGRDL